MTDMTVKEKSGGKIAARIIRADGSVEDLGIICGGSLKERIVSKLKRWGLM